MVSQVERIRMKALNALWNAPHCLCTQLLWTRNSLYNQKLFFYISVRVKQDRVVSGAVNLDKSRLVVYHFLQCSGERITQRHLRLFLLFAVAV